MSELPRSLRLVRWAVGVVILVHLVALVLLLTHRDVIHGTVLADNPGWSAEKVDEQANSLVLQSVVPHVLIPLLLAFRLRSLKAHKRTFLTVLLAIQLLAHASLPITLHELPGYDGAVIAVQAVSLVFEVSALWLLWATDDAKVWFTARPR